jgi:ankyrin
MSELWLLFLALFSGWKPTRRNAFLEFGAGFHSLLILIFLFMKKLIVAAFTAVALLTFSNAQAQDGSTDIKKGARQMKRGMKKEAHEAGQDIKEGTDKAGAAIKRGADKTGDAIREGADKTGDAVDREARKTKRAVRRGVGNAAEDVEKGAKKVKKDARNPG